MSRNDQMKTQFNETEIQNYAKTHGIVSPDAISRLTGEWRQLALPGFETSYRKVLSPSMTQRERASSLKELHSPQKLAEAFKDGDLISSILPEYVKGNIPSFNIVGSVIETPEDFAKLTWTLRSPYMEVLKVAFLNQNGKAVHSAMLSVGTINEAMVHPQMILREVQRLASKTNTNQIIISHNHPSGDPTPSTHDIRATSALLENLKIAGIELTDHIITNGKTFSSWRQGWAISSLETPQPDWELVSRSQLSKIQTPEDLEKIVTSLRQADPGHDHIIYGDVKLQVTAVERVPATLPLDDLSLRIARGSGREGALNVWFETVQRETMEVTRLGYTLEKIQINLLDAGTSSIRSLRAAGILKETAVSIVKNEDRTPESSAKALDAVKNACGEAMSPRQNIELER